MKYLALANYLFADSPGGGSRVAWDIACRMRDDGHETAMLCQKVRPDDPDLARVDGIDVVRFARPQFARLDPTKPIRTARAAAAAAERSLAARQWDIAHTYFPWQRRLAERLAPSARRVHTVLSPDYYENRFNWLSQGITGRIKWLLGGLYVAHAERTILAGSNAVHAMSDYTAGLLESRYGRLDNVRVVPHWRRDDMRRTATKAQARQKLGWQADAKILFSVRGLHKRYGLDLAIRAAAPALRSCPGMMFCIAGHGPMMEYLKDLADQQGLSRRICLMGRVDDQTLQACYEAADLFVLPTVAMECFGLIVLEAYSVGLPVLSTDAGSLPELLGPLCPQLIVPAGDERALEEKINLFAAGKLDCPSPQQIEEYLENRYSAARVWPKLVNLITGITPTV
ncbi:MAG: glycosyltransferase family 4 protein [Planctomycetes bacterium]|nr:glycosyltransferase family 4 protein [Planctomycetota bacterium]